MKKIFLLITMMISMTISANAQIKVTTPIQKGIVTLVDYIGRASGCYLSFDPNDSTYTINRKSLNQFDPYYRFELGGLDEAKKTIQSLLDLLNSMDVDENCVITFPADYKHREYFFSKESATYRKKVYYGFYVKGIEGYADHTYLNQDELELYLNALNNIKTK